MAYTLTRGVSACLKLKFLDALKIQTFQTTNYVSLYKDLHISDYDYVSSISIFLC